MLQKGGRQFLCLDKLFFFFNQEKINLPHRLEGGMRRTTQEGLLLSGSPHLEPLPSAERLPVPLSTSAM